MAKVWLVLFLSATASFAQLPSEIDRLMAATRLWVTLNYFHPAFAAPCGNRAISDGLDEAVSKVRRAKNITDYRAAVSLMLSQLNDPDTFLIPDVDAGVIFPKPFPKSPRENVIQTSSGSSINIANRTTDDMLVLDLSGIQIAIRLTGPVQSRSQSVLCSVMDYSPGEADSFYPNENRRLLAAIKLYGAIHYFFAYKDLMDEDWEDVFPTYVTKFMAAKDATEYNLVLSDLLTHLTDTNAQVQSKTMTTYFGEAPVGLHIRLLDKYPIVTDVLDPAAKAAGIEPGDIVKRVGGISTTDIFNRFVQYIPASTPQRSGYDTIQKVTNGQPGSQIELVIENSKGEAHPVTLTRSAAPSAQRTTDAIRILPGNIGYLDLERLPETEVDAALTKLKDTKAIIFDLRSPIAPAASDLASHLTTKRNVAAEIVTTPIALHPDVPTDVIATQTASTFVVKTLPHPREPYYKGKTIALIDERTIGESEHTALLFEAANRTEFIGAPSAGAYSNIAELHLPGEITVTFSTEDIRHSNGGKLQRLGIQPNILAPTTTMGLREGKDEALEAALAHLAK